MVDQRWATLLEGEPSCVVARYDNATRCFRKNRTEFPRWFSPRVISTVNEWSARDERESRLFQTSRNKQNPRLAYLSSVGRKSHLCSHFTPCAGNWFADHNEWPNTVYDNSSLSFWTSVWYPLDRNLTNLLFVLPELYVNILNEDWENIAILGQKIFDVRGIPAQEVNCDREGDRDDDVQPDIGKSMPSRQSMLPLLYTLFSGRQTVPNGETLICSTVWPPKFLRAPL